MANSIIAGSQQQSPASKAFQHGQAPNNPANTPKVQEGPQAAHAQDATLKSGKTEEINEKLALSRDKSRVNPSQVFSNTEQRGQNLNITV